MEYNNNYNKRLKLNHFSPSSKQQKLLFATDYQNGYNNNTNKSGYQNFATNHNTATDNNNNYVRTTRKKSHMSSTKQDNQASDKPLFSRVLVLYPREANEAEIRRYFQKFGHIQGMSVVKDQSIPTELGAAYIKYSKASEALAAIEQMDGKVLDSCRGNILRVVLSEDGAAKGYKSNEPFTTKLYVKIDKTMNRYDLTNMFKKYGKIEGSYVYLDRESRESKGYGTVTFAKPSEAAIALEECDPCFHAKFSFPFSPTSMETKQPARIETPPVADFSNYDSNHSQQPLYENISYLQQQNENLLKHFTGLISQGHDLNNNISEVYNNNEPFKFNFEKIIRPTLTQQQQQPVEKVKVQDARVVVRKVLPVEVEHPFSITNENLGNDYALKVKTNLSEAFLKSLLNLIPGLIVFKTTCTLESNAEYLVRYTNDLNTFHALKKINQIEFPAEQFVNAEYVKEADIKLSSDKSHTKTEQVLVLIDCEKELKLELLKLIFNQFNNVLRCGLNGGNKSGFAIFANEYDATLAVNILDNKEIAMNHLRVHIEQNIEDFLFKDKKVP